MNKTIVMVACMVMLCLGAGAQTLGEKYKLPEAAGELRADGVYHLPTSLLANSPGEVTAYFRFFPEDGTFIVYHSRVSPEDKAKVFQINCNYEYVSSTTAPFNRDYRLKTKGNVHRARIVYPDKALLLELDVRQDVIAATIRTFDPDGKMIGKPAKYVMPFHQIAWPMSAGD